MSELHDLTAGQLGEAMRRGETTSLAATEAVLARLEATRHLGAWLAVDADEAKRQARLADKRREAGLVIGPLDGIPLGLKDNVMTRGRVTTCGSKILEGFVAPYDATVASRLHRAGAVLVGKLNMDEFAMGSSSEHSAYGPVHNPWDVSRVPGGSSGGSAAAVAAGSVTMAIGTDTGGSIRQPASLTGIVGLKPTYGRVSRAGVIAYASSLDQVGPMTKDVTDCALMLEAMAGYDTEDMTSSEVPTEAYASHLKQASLKGLKVGVLAWPESGIHPEVRRLTEEAIAFYRDAGAQIVEVALPHTEHAIATYYVLAPAEASSNLARYDGVRFGARSDEADGLLSMYLQTRGGFFGAEVRRRIMLGTYVLSSGYYEAYYCRAQKVRRRVAEDFSSAFEKVDVLLTPTSPVPAFKLQEREADPVAMYMSDVFTVSANLAGLPAISLPAGWTETGLPVGMQLVGPAWSEGRLLQSAFVYEQAHAWHQKRAVL